MKGWVVALLVAVGVLLAIFGTFFAQGAPTVPTATLSTPIQPGAGQSLLFNLNMGDYSVIAVNNIWDLGAHFTYSAIERTSLNAVYVLASNATIAPSVGASSGDFYQLNAPITLFTTAACSGVNCAGVTENITLTLFGVVVTPLAAYQSAKSVSVFSSSGVGVGCTAGIPCPPTTQSPSSIVNPAQPTPSALDTFLLSILGPFTLLIGVVTLGAYVSVWKHPILPVAAAVAFTLFIVELVVL